MSNWMRRYTPLDPAVAEFAEFKRKLTREYATAAQHTPPKSHSNVRLKMQKYLHEKIYFRQTLNKQHRFSSYNNNDEQSHKVNNSLRMIGKKLSKDKEYKMSEQSNVMQVIKNKLYFLSAGRTGAIQREVDKTRDKIVKKYLKDSPFFKLLNQVSEIGTQVMNQEQKRQQEEEKQSKIQQQKAKIAKMQEEFKHLQRLDENLKTQQLFNKIASEKSSRCMSATHRKPFKTSRTARSNVTELEAKVPHYSPTRTARFIPQPMNLIHKSLGNSATLVTSTPQTVVHFKQSRRIRPSTAVFINTISYDRPQQQDLNDIKEYLKIDTALLFDQHESLMLTGTTIGGTR